MDNHVSIYFVYQLKTEKIMDEPGVLSVRMDGQTNKLVDMLAASRGVSRSDWLRIVITAAVRDQCVELTVKQIKEAA